MAEQKRTSVNCPLLHARQTRGLFCQPCYLGGSFSIFLPPTHTNWGISYSINLDFERIIKCEIRFSSTLWST